MSLKGIKALVAGLHTDGELRSRFAADPDHVLSQFSLTTEQRAAIKGTHLRIGAGGALSIQESEGPDGPWWIP